MKESLSYIFWPDLRGIYSYNADVCDGLNQLILGQTIYDVLEIWR